MAEVAIEDLGKRFDGPGRMQKWVLRHVSLNIEDGGLLVLVGPSGAGKTTLLRLLAGLETITEGCVRINGRVINALHPKDRDMALVSQNHALYPHLSVRENLALGLKLRNLPRTVVEERVRQTAQVLGLEGCLERIPATLSGGERQRAALGRAVARRPGVLLLDEPFSNLDAPRRVLIRQQLADLHRHLGVTVLCATHDQADAMALGTRLAVLNDGQLQQVDAPSALYQRPDNVFVAGFLGAPPMNLFQGRLVPQAPGLRFQATAPEVDAPTALGFRLSGPRSAALFGLAGQAVICGVRAEDLECIPDGQPGEGVALATLDRAESAGADTCLHLKVQGLCPPQLAARVTSSETWQTGQRIGIRFNPERAHFFDPVTGRRAG